MAKDFWVYKAYDREMDLVYVGISGVGPARLAQHRRSSAWAPVAYAIVVEHFPTRPQALERERALILKHRPPFNISGNPEHGKARRSRPVGRMTIGEAAERIRCGPEAIRRQLDSGRLLAVQDGRRVWIREEDLDAWVEASRVAPGPELVES